MAAPVLPYPDMDFTPLDILTAEEMNQMVANDEYLKTYAAGLADGSNLSDGIIQAQHIKDGAITSAKIASKTITGGNIADSTIQAQNVDFATIYEVVESKETEYTIPASKTQVWSKQVEKSGLYILNVFVEGNDAGSSHAIDYNINMGSKSYHKWWISGINQNSRYCTCGSVSLSEILNANETIKLSLWRSAQAGSSFSARVFINLVRIG